MRILMYSKKTYRRAECSERRCPLQDSRGILEKSGKYFFRPEPESVYPIVKASSWAPYGAISLVV